MLFDRLSLPLSRSPLDYLSGVLRAGTASRPVSKNRALPAGQQAFMTLAYLKNAHTFAQLGAGFNAGTTTAWRHANEAGELLKACSCTVQVPFGLLKGRPVFDDPGLRDELWQRLNDNPESTSWPRNSTCGPASRSRC